ncbi:MAG: flagellar assembly protein FliX [Pseudomonadota bacterium]|nr:flagellar assembly protein FliX [Pseudomonadota bacterium]
MKIERQGINGTSGVSRTRRKDGQAGGSFHVDESTETHTTTGLTGLSGASALGAALIAQQDDPSAYRRRQNFRRAESMLDRLDEIRVGLLTGRLDRATLERLASSLAESREQESDPAVKETLDAIDLRVAVELAKYHV